MLRVVAPVLLSVALVSSCGEGTRATPAASGAAASTSPSASASPTAAPSPTGAPALTKAQFLDQAEKLCGDAVVTIEGIREPTDAAEIKATLQTSLDTLTDASAALDELAAEQPDIDELEQIFLTPLREQAEAFEEFVPQLAASLTKLAELEGALKRFGELSSLDPETLTDDQLDDLEQLTKDLDPESMDAELPEPDFVEPDLAAMKAYGFDRCLTLGDQEE